MKRPNKVRSRHLVCVLAIAEFAGTLAGQALPATAPTASMSQLPSANPPVQRAVSHLAVLWDGVQLRVEATNASLNAVLHEIAEKTHMTVTGSTPDERIFGSYGPGPLNLIVPALLDGVAVNMLLTEREGGAKNELLLTSRQGGPTPSYVPTQQDSEAGNGVELPQGQPRNQNNPRGSFAGGPRRVRGGPVPPNGNDPVVPDNGFNGRDNGINGPNNGVNGADNGMNGQDNGMNGTDNGVNNTATPGTVSTDGTINQPSTGSAASGTDSSTSTDSTSPNGVKTPQEIFEQLQKLRQQQTTVSPQ